MDFIKEVFNMKKALILVPVCAAAAGAAVFFAMKKPKGEAAPKEKKAPAAKGGAASKKEKKAAPKDLKSGSYSFISGFQNAAEVEMSLQYDSNVYFFEIIDEDFLTYSSDSHVAVIRGADFSMQLEYAGYYGGEDFSGLSKSVSERYQGFGEVSYGAVKGIKYLDGDSVCLCIPVTDDQASYILVNILASKDYDEPFYTLVDHPDVKDIIASMQFTKKA